MTERLFVYGTLKNARIQKVVFGRSEPGEPDELVGFSLSSLKMGSLTCPVVVSDPSSSVMGIVISVTPEELRRIDRYETEAYMRVRVTLKSGINTWVYIENREYKDR